MLGFFQNRFGLGYSGVRIYQVDSIIGGSADLAIISILTGSPALWTIANDKSVGEEQLFVNIEELVDVFLIGRNT